MPAARATPAVSAQPAAAPTPKKRRKLESTASSPLVSGMQHGPFQYCALPPAGAPLPSYQTAAELVSNLLAAGLALACACSHFCLVSIFFLAAATLGFLTLQAADVSRAERKFLHATFLQKDARGTAEVQAAAEAVRLGLANLAFAINQQVGSSLLAGGWYVSQRRTVW